MTNQEIARQRFTAHLDANSAFFRGDRPEPTFEETQVRHGWTHVNGEGFNMELAFPERFHPRFPADQGCSD